MKLIGAAIGPVGSFVIQLAKADGLKVIASAGSDEKVEFMKSIGADVAFNYKTKDINGVLAKEGPIDMYVQIKHRILSYISRIPDSYWDNVGGASLDAALQHSARYARFIVSSMLLYHYFTWSMILNLVSYIVGMRHDLRIQRGRTAGQESVQDSQQ